MDYIEVERLADQYREVLGVEFEAKMRVLGATEKAEGFKVAFLVEARAAGAIDGKTVKDRELQRLDLLFESDSYQAHRGTLAIHQAKADLETIEVKHAKELIKLTAAWLESQKGGVVVNKPTEDCDHDQVVECVRDAGFLPEQAFEFNDLAAWAIDNGLVAVDTPETGPGRDV